MKLVLIFTIWVKKILESYDSVVWDMWGVQSGTEVLQVKKHFGKSLEAPYLQFSRDAPRREFRGGFFKTMCETKEKSEDNIFEPTQYSLTIIINLSKLQLRINLQQTKIQLHWVFWFRDKKVVWNWDKILNESFKNLVESALKFMSRFRMIFLPIKLFYNISIKFKNEFLQI